MSSKRIGGEYYNKRFSTILNENVNNSFSSPIFPKSPLYKSYSEASPAKTSRYQKLVHKSGTNQDYLSPDLSIVRRKSMARVDSSGRYSQSIHGVNRAASVHSSFPFCRPNRSDTNQLKPTSLVQSMRINSQIMRDRNEKDSVIRALQIMESKKRNFQECDISDCGDNSLSDDVNHAPISKRQRIISGSSHVEGLSSSSSASQKDELAKLSKQDTFRYTSMRDISTGRTKVNSFGLGGTPDIFKVVHTSNGNSKHSDESPDLSRASTPSLQLSQSSQPIRELKERSEGVVNGPMKKSTIRRRISYMTPSQIESQLSNRSAAVDLMRLDDKGKKNVSMTRSAVTQTDSYQNKNSVYSASDTDKPLSVAELIANIDKNRKNESPLEKATTRKPGAKDDYMEKRLSRIRTLIAKFSESTPEPSIPTNSNASSMKLPLSLTSVQSQPTSIQGGAFNPAVSKEPIIAPQTSLSLIISTSAENSQPSSAGFAFTSIPSSSTSSVLSGMPASSSIQLKKPAADFTASTSTSGFTFTAAPQSSSNVSASHTALSSKEDSTVIITPPTLTVSTTSTVASVVEPVLLSTSKPSMFSFGSSKDTNSNMISMPFKSVSTSSGFKQGQLTFSTPAPSTLSVDFSKPATTEISSSTQKLQSSNEARKEGSVLSFATPVTTSASTSSIPPVSLATDSSNLRTSLFANVQSETNSRLPTVSNTNKEVSNQFTFGKQLTEQKSLFSSTSSAASESLFKNKLDSSQKENSTSNFTLNTSKNFTASTQFNFGAAGSTKNSQNDGKISSSANTVLFGSQSAGKSTSVNLFGKDQTQTTSLFNNTTTTKSGPLFGTSALSNSGNILGASSSSSNGAKIIPFFGASSESSSNIFSFSNNSESTSNKNSIFSQPISQPSSFGGSSQSSSTIFPSVTNSESTANKNKDIFGQAASQGSLFGGNSISSNNLFSSTTKSENTTNKQTSLFGQPPISQNSQPTIFAFGSGGANSTTTTQTGLFGSSQTFSFSSQSNTGSKAPNPPPNNNSSFLFGNNADSKGSLTQSMTATTQANPSGCFNFSNSKATPSGGFDFSSGQAASTDFKFGAQPSQNVFNANSVSSSSHRRKLVSHRKR